MDTNDGTYSPAPTQPAASEATPATTELPAQPMSSEEQPATASPDSESASSAQPAQSPTPVENNAPEQTQAEAEPQPSAAEPVVLEPAAQNDTPAPAAEDDAASSAPVEGDNTPAQQPLAPSNTAPAPAPKPTPVATAPVVRQPVAAEPSTRMDRVFAVGAVETRSSLRRLANEEQAEADAARNHAAEVQKNRILRGLLDTIVNTDPAVTKSTLLADTGTDAPQASLIETYYAQA